MSKTAGCVALLLAVVGITFLSVILNGWAFTVLWSWFVIPIFHLPSLTIPYAIGLGLIASMLTNHTHTNNDSRDASGKIASLAGEVVVRPIAAIVIGAIVRLFI